MIGTIGQFNSLICVKNDNYWYEIVHFQKHKATKYLSEEVEFSIFSTGDNHFSRIIAIIDWDNYPISKPEHSLNPTPEEVRENHYLISWHYWGDDCQETKNRACWLTDEELNKQGDVKVTYLGESRIRKTTK